MADHRRTCSRRHQYHPIVSGETGPDLFSNTVAEGVARVATSDRHHWNQAVLLDFLSDIDIVALDGAVRTVIAQHDSLRMAFRFDGEAVHAEVLAPDLCASGLRYVSLEDASGNSRGMNSGPIRELQSSLALDRPPLFIAALVKAADRERGRLLLICHHLVIDSVSWQILVDDLSTAYEGVKNGMLTLMSAPPLRDVTQHLVALVNEPRQLNECGWPSALP